MGNSENKPSSSSFSQGLHDGNCTFPIIMHSSRNKAQVIVWVMKDPVATHLCILEEGYQEDSLLTLHLSEVGKITLARQDGLVCYGLLMRSQPSHSIVPHVMENKYRVDSYEDCMLPWKVEVVLRSKERKDSVEYLFGSFRMSDPENIIMCKNMNTKECRVTGEIYSTQEIARKLSSFISDKVSSFICE